MGQRTTVDRPPVVARARNGDDGSIDEGRRRAVVEAVAPEVDAGRFPIKRVAGERVVVEADVFADGHDRLAAVVRWRHDDARNWHEVPMAPVDNDRWRGSFVCERDGWYRYTVVAWIDHFETWRVDLRTKADAGQDVASDLEAGARLVEGAAGRASGSDAGELRRWAARIRGGADDALAAGADEELRALMWRHGERRHPTEYDRELRVVVDRRRARFSAWYELFPRSASPDPSRAGTLADVEALLPEVAAMGFDVLYLPPIHPIGRTNRKGKNNAPRGGSDDPGSPWAIGAAEGGHTAIDPGLGTFDDFARLVSSAERHGIEIALDLAFQCAPDHPWVSEHPEWFRRRPDGSIAYAENPPKKYEDIYPLDFETPAWRELWEALAAVVRFWIDRGVRIFRVDNPHTKALGFWEWLIASIKADHHDVLFLSEAFTRPKLMYRLAKLGFTQSYTYFAWRNEKWELEQYLTEVSTPPVSEFFRPNLWPNTPDILTAALQFGGKPAFVQRLILAATLGASYGIYGPAFELGEHRAIAAGREEYLNSEKYEVRHWDRPSAAPMRELIARVNAIRREHAALQTNETLRFHGVDNDRLIAYSKRSGDDVVLVVVNLDPVWTQGGWTSLWMEQLGLRDLDTFDVEDLLTNARYRWQGQRNYVELNPHLQPAHIFRVRPPR